MFLFAQSTLPYTQQHDDAFSPPDEGRYWGCPAQRINVCLSQRHSQLRKTMDLCLA
jgi:hypothetical protein